MYPRDTTDQKIPHVESILKVLEKALSTKANGINNVTEGKGEPKTSLDKPAKNTKRSQGREREAKGRIATKGSGANTHPLRPDINREKSMQRRKVIVNLILIRCNDRYI